ncbi:hypothetical protein [Pedobacter sp. NJ-S-72]
MENKSAQKYHLYQKIARGLEQQIKNNVLAIGDNFPRFVSSAKFMAQARLLLLKYTMNWKARGLLKHGLNPVTL